MGMVGKEIIQSRVWVDPNAPAPPDLNYKNTYPITVLEAVKESTNDNAISLNQILDEIHQELKNKQPIFAGKPANYLMTFAGTAGGVGSIAMTKEIPWDKSKQRHDRIPTEKAVGDLMLKLGLVDDDGNIDPNGGKKILWADVIGRPKTYTTLGTNDDGYITQAAISEVVNKITDDLHLLSIDHEGKIIIVNTKIDNHIADKNNPHNVTLDQIGAVSKESFEFHTGNLDNPHSVTKVQIGLANVDNTSDINKPISKSTQDALNIINTAIQDLNSDLANSVIDGNYDQSSGTLTLVLKNGSKLIMHIPINGLVDEIVYDKSFKELLVAELGGEIKKVDLSDLFIRYIGSTQSHITVEIDGSQATGNQTIKATINVKSITDNEMADNSVITRIIKDQSITTDKIKDLSVTTIKLDDGSVTTEKLGALSVITTKIADRAVTGKKMFSSGIESRVLGVIHAGSDPQWLQIGTDMIAEGAVRPINIMNKSITGDEIADGGIFNSNLEDLAVSTEKIKDLAITNEKIFNSTISGIKLVTDILLMGTPRITERPLSDASNDQVPDTYWVKDQLYNLKVRNDNLTDRCVDARTLFSSPADNKALVVLSANSDPIWGLINNGMMADNSINTGNIIDLSVTDPKIADSAVRSRHIADFSILTNHIKEGAVESTRIWESEFGNRILATLSDNSHPVYTQLNRAMMLDSVVGTKQVEDRAITLSKLSTSTASNRILGVVLKNSDPVWMQATNGMLGDRSVDGRVLFTSSTQNRVLAVTELNTDPAWMQINGDMIKDLSITENHITSGAILNRHLQEAVVEGHNIAKRTIKSINIAERAITGSELFTSPEPNRILAVTNSPYADPQWMQLTTDMIANEAVAREKIFQSEYPYRVLGVTQENVPPEYLKITSDFIVDDTIIPQKLVRDFTLYGVPSSTERPATDANNRQIPDTYWVRKTIANTMKDFNPKILFDTVSKEMIQEHCIDGSRLFTYDHAPRVIGITEPGGNAEYILVEEDLIADGAVTKTKIQKDITLMGSPTIEVRPFPDASDARGGGSLIPDCQWVLNAIGGSGGGIPKFDPEFFIETSSGLSLNLVNILTARAKIDELFSTTGPGGDPGTGTGTGTGGGTVLTYESVTTNHLANRAVTGDKLFTSPVANRLLGVLAANTSPQYIQATNDMLADRAVNGRSLFTSGSSNKILGVTTAGTDPQWMLVNNNMMDADSVGTKQLIDISVANSKIASRAVNGRTLFTSNNANRVLGVTDASSDPAWIQINADMMEINSIRTVNLQNGSVTTNKLAEGAVTQTKLDEAPIIDTVRLVDKSVTSDKIADQGVENHNILDHTIQSEKLVENIELPGHPTVKPDSGTSYQTRALRNTIISPDAPSGGENGDIWLRYI